MRKRTLLLTVVGVLATASAAAAAWVILTGLTGSATGTFATATTNPAISVVLGTVPSTLSPGTSIVIPATLTNNNASASETAGTPSATFTTTPASCASHLSYTNPGQIAGVVLTAGQSGVSVNGGVAISADATLPSTCSAGSFTVNITGTTTP